MNLYLEDEVDFSLPLKKKKKKKPKCVSASEVPAVDECNIAPPSMKELTWLGMNNMHVDQPKESGSSNNSPKSGEEIFYSDDELEKLNNSLEKSQEIFFRDGDIKTVGKENSFSKPVNSVSEFENKISDVTVLVDLGSALDFTLPKKKKKMKFISENTDPEMVKRINAPEICDSDNELETLNNSLNKSQEIFCSDNNLETAGKENSISKPASSMPQFKSKTLDVNVSPVLDLESSLDFSLAKKKKKKKPLYISENTDPEIVKRIIAPKMCDSLIADTDEADYTYEYMLTRIFQKMREKNPLIDEVDRNKVVIKPPQIIRIGTKRSSFVNFLELCKIMHRPPAHLQSFLLVELGTTGSIDGNGHLLIKGKFQQKQIESVLRRYIKEYVTCHSCRSPNTVLLKETRLYFIKCESCGSQSSVPVIKSGFQAVISKRAATRIKANT